MTSSRPYTKYDAHMAAAKAYAKLSKAKRLKVGAVLVKEDRIISLGYNGTPRGGSNICEVLIRKVLVTKPEVLHAEENCIAFAAKNGISTEGCALITTHSPCFPCSRLLIQAGIKEVWYETEYRDTDGLELLRNHDVYVGRLDERQTKRTSTAAQESA